ncbi:translation initiation factor IF-2 [Bradyrhizobium sp. U87765 SZCCT0131]|uniref:translation initiation factor IF-2 n=1 Tax=unclassified Bradyrhizobium TaxID=2631580 RepID=UPI001BAE1272|nr:MULTISPECIES: translation initiation factor IF-2 [unclassified Bradyrhizobium]MBR1216676.1 translation initiation factor IF-2 [Bradyrhizobium sp. U87765 SZCCT0131]MBR1259568.1 translation initiation factor IF-2 [Bradyrhizobium sp. U87765 SZCCT0134]MBR1305709.1 translation initiation factor IF-2 [Bradyrhizobium sp. U87765 SZCCT0110]MBR1322076.1 translation initiation factor IF-2 [Bradyrhizobium sp. U87765 SZCCT0109]MBR1350646.1 translation initiation factor IF-2 [Bradyrhizobium sp. U87765 SZ
MAETKNPGDKTLSVGSKTLSLKPRTETGVVRQSFSHGRTKSVVVEKKTKRRMPGDPPEPVAAASPRAPEPQQAKPAAPPPSRPAPSAPPRSSSPQQRGGSGVVLRSLTEDERSARAMALADARLRDVEERRIAEEEAQRRASREFQEQQEREAAEARAREEAARRRLEDEAKRKAELEAKKRFGEDEAKARSTTAPTTTPAARPSGAPPARTGAPTSRPASSTARPGTPGAARPAGGLTAGRPPAVAAEADDDEARRPVRRGPGGARPVIPPKTTAKPGPQKQRGRLTVVTALTADDVRERSVASFRRRTQRLKGHQANEPKEKLIREVVIPEAITIQELANRMAERAVDVIRMLMKQGQMVKITDTIDADTAQLIAEELGHTVKRVADSDVEEGLFDVAEDHASDQTPRPPVVTVMGHVDHGKTSLLDALRHANVVSGEAGGITQHIGAYQVTSPQGGKITFIDTPGHAAFTAMRARGAKVTDIVVLVVAADDGVMPQTIEAINHAKAAKVPMIIAINKIDKPDAKPERVRTELLQHEVQVESFGGDVVDVEVSAKNKTNLDKLLEMISLQAELLDLKTNPDRPAEGTVIEAKLDRGRGPVATVLVQRGTLRIGDIIVAGAEMGRVRALISDQGTTIQEAGPSVPVEVLGFNGPPEAGDRLAVVENEARARQITDYRAHQKREKQAARNSGMRGSLEQMMSQLKTAGRKEFPLVIKADVQGSLEAILGSLEKLGTDEVAARVLHAGVGGISESDVTLAEGFNAAIIGFNVRAHKEAGDAAKRDGIEIRYYNIIYDLVDDVKKAMSGLLAPTLRETMLGNAQVLEVFNISKVGKIAGCRVTDGTVERGANVRLIRDNVVIHEGKLGQLKRFKDDAKEVVAGQECGMSFENYQDMRPGDIIECYRVETIQRSL